MTSTRLALLLALQLAAGSAFTACGGDSGSDAADDDDTGSKTGDMTPQPTGNGGLALTFSPMYSAFIEGGAHEAQVPVMLKDTSLRNKGAKFRSSDTSIATVVDTAEGGMITVKKDGVVTITGELEGDSGSAKLTIKKYTEAQWMAGQARYSKSELAIPPAADGSVNLIGLATGAMRNANGACNTCHTAQAQTLKIENGPQQIAGYSDDELITIFTMGKKPAEATQKSMIPAFVWGMVHAWTVTEEEKQGLIAFLRTQQPRPNPAMIDYGVGPCPGSPAPTAGGGFAGGIPMLCDTKTGKPIPLPGRGDAGAPTTATPDAGSTTTTTTADAGVGAGDAG